eukprot:754455-Hanusia_phi.AAC.4
MPEVSDETRDTRNDEDSRTTLGMEVMGTERWLSPNSISCQRQQPDCAVKIENAFMWIKNPRGT